MPVPNTSPPRVLLVEGPDDKHVVAHLCRNDTSMSELSILDKGGISPLLDAIEAEVMAPSREVVGILMDANDSPDNRWQAVANRLLKAGIDTPDQPDPAGTVIDGSPRVGIWLMPNNRTRGELEDFIAEMVPKNDTVWLLSKAYVEGIPDIDRKFKAGKTLRAKMHSWLAVRAEPRQMGSAIGAGDLDVNAPDAVRFVTWLRRLLG